MNDTRSALRGGWLLTPLLLLLAILPLGHVQALRTTLCVAVGIAALAAGRKLAGDVRHLFVWWLAWLVFGLASAFWSVTPELSLRSGVYELVLPAIVFFGAVRLTDTDVALRRAAAALATGVAVLAALSVAAHLTGRPLALISADYQSGMFRYHPGVGVASTFVALAFPVWLMLLRCGRVWRTTAIALIACTLAVGTAAPNRMLWITLFGCGLVFVVAKRRRISAVAIGRFVLAVAIAGVLTAALFFYTAQQHAQTTLAGPDQLMELVTSDRRLAGWQAWLTQAQQRPLLGAGLGESAPSAAYGQALPAELLHVERAFFNHAHNLFVNTLLQLGVVGLALFVCLLAALGRYYWRALADPPTAVAGRAGLTLIAAMLLKNTTDDFMDYAVVISFWAIAGMLVGVIARRKAIQAIEASS
jgi:O-antigen ligase